MKITRKPDVQRVRIVGHNKTLFYIIIFLLVVLIGVIIAIQIIPKQNGINNPANNSDNKTQDAPMCISDSDCVKIQTTCCPCSSGGSEVCGNLAENDYWQENLKNNCQNAGVCPQVYGCFLDSCACVEGKCAPKNNNQLANPASVYCTQNGGRLEIKTSADGSQYGLCVFPNNSSCEEWAYFRGECNKTG